MKKNQEEIPLDYFLSQVTSPKLVNYKVKEKKTKNLKKSKS